MIVLEERMTAPYYSSEESDTRFSLPLLFKDVLDPEPLEFFC